MAAAVVLQGKHVNKIRIFSKKEKNDLRDSVSTTSHGLLTTLALPDTNGSTLDSILTTEGTGVGGVLSDFHLLYGLSERGTITGTVFTGDSDLLSALSLQIV